MTPLNEVRSSIAEVRSALVAPDPESLQEQVPALTAAIEKMRLLMDGGASPDSLPALRDLLFDLAACRKLIDRGSATVRILSGILSSGSAGYGRNGARPFPSGAATVSLRG